MDGIKSWQSRQRFQSPFVILGPGVEKRAVEWIIQLQVPVLVARDAFLSQRFSTKNEVEICIYRKSKRYLREIELFEYSKNIQKIPKILISLK